MLINNPTLNSCITYEGQLYCMPRLLIRTFFVNDKMPKGDEKMKKGKTNWKIKERRGSCE